MGRGREKKGSESEKEREGGREREIEKREREREGECILYYLGDCLRANYNFDELREQCTQLLYPYSLWCSLLKILQEL